MKAWETIDISMIDQSFLELYFNFSSLDPAEQRLINASLVEWAQGGALGGEDGRATVGAEVGAVVVGTNLVICANSSGASVGETILASNISFWIEAVVQSELLCFFYRTF